jgi:YHS domain-containing protein
MTAARQQRKHRLGIVALAGLLWLPPAITAPRAATSERNTGLAIRGDDPVAFYTDGKAMPGDADLELTYDGAVWRFCNIGNREAFAARPEVYMPRFGGYDPVGVARGVAVAGNPNTWLISGDRLFLFYDRDRLETFRADPERINSAAERKWPDVLRTLGP